MPKTFDDFIAEIEEEAFAEGPCAVSYLEELRTQFASYRQRMRDAWESFDRRNGTDLRGLANR